MKITPYSALAVSLAPTAANFPALQHFWECDNATDTGTLIDSVGGVIVDTSGGTQTINADGSLTLSAPGTLLSGTLASPGTKHILAFAMYAPATTARVFTFGSIAAAANSGFSIKPGATAGPKLNDGTTQRTSTAMRTADGADATYAMTISPNSATGFSATSFDGTTWTDHADTETNTATAYTTLAAIEQAMAVPSSKIFMFGLMYFTTLPPAGSIKAGLEWMHYYAITDSDHSKLIYPGWKDLA